MPLPALRYLDVIPIEHEGEQFICLRDPAGFVDEQLVLTPLAFFIAAQLTGETGIEHIQESFKRNFGGIEIPPERILEVVEYLDERAFLLSPKFEQLRDKQIDSFRKSDSRPAYLAGKSYPDDPAALRVFLDSLFLREGGPGSGIEGVVARGAPLRGLVVPHIDFHRGGHCYAHGYLRMFKAGRPDTVLVFGVAHMSEPVPFILTRKHFETPLGTIETDLNVVGRLAQTCSWDPFEYELTHRTEHSIEFQAVMLRYLYGANVRMVPILCSTFSTDPVAQTPTELTAINAFLDTCHECIAEDGRKVSVIAAADLAHVGKRFGDPFDIDDVIVNTVRTRDDEDLEHVHSLDADRFYASVMKDLNQRKVCGVNCIYAALRSLDGLASRSQPLHYDYAHDPAGGIVSFASIAIH